MLVWPPIEYDDDLPVEDDAEDDRGEYDIDPFYMSDLGTGVYCEGGELYSYPNGCIYD